MIVGNSRILSSIYVKKGTNASSMKPYQNCKRENKLVFNKENRIPPIAQHQKS